MMNFIAQSMRRFGLAPDNKKDPSIVSPTAGSFSADPLSHLKIGGKWSYSTLEYPRDIQARSDLGHYMMFYINVPVNSAAEGKGSKSRKKDMNKVGGSLTKSMGLGMGSLNVKVPKVDTPVASLMNQAGFSASASSKGETAGFGYTEHGATWTPGQQDVVIERKHYEGNTSRVIGEQRMMRTSDSIILYMPPQIVENYNAQYKESELGKYGGEGAALAREGLQAFRQSLSDTANTPAADGLAALTSGLKVLATNAKEQAADKMGQAGGGDLKGMMLKADNKAINNFLEVMFTGIGHRKFSYTWKIAPKNDQESVDAYEIIQKFKYHMAPEIGGKNHGRYFTTPSEFDIFYMFRGEENSWINKISSCVLLNLDVNYTPQQYQTFRPNKNRKGAPPVEMDLKLDFMETRLITKELIKDGY